MKYLKVAITSFIFFYLIGAFYSTTFILSDWTEEARFVISALIITTTILPWAVMGIEENIKG